MSNQNKINTQFTGGDNLMGFLRCYHEIIMMNELRGGEGAYKLSYAGGESGFSFGGNQMDMHIRPDVIKVFIDILTLSTDKSGNKIFTKKEINEIVGVENSNLKKTSQTLKNVFGEYLPRINAALSSEYGRAAIDAAYVNEMKEKANHVEKALQLIQNPAAKKFYDSDLGRILLFDYHNQFTLNLEDVFMVNYLDGTYHNKSKTIYGSNKTTVAPTDHYTLEDHKAYIYSTEQWHKYQVDCERRLNNILDLYENKKLFQKEEPTSLKSFGLHWDDIKGEWVGVEPIPFTGNGFLIMIQKNTYIPIFFTIVFLRA